MGKDYSRVFCLEKFSEFLTRTGRLYEADRYLDQALSEKENYGFEGFEFKKESLFIPNYSF